MEKLVLGLIKMMVDKVVSRIGDEVLDYLIATVKEQEETLRRVERMLGQHITGPFHVGLTYLEEARHAFNEQKRQEELNEAKKAFIAVAHLDSQDFPFISIQAQFYVGVCYTLLFEHDNALRWYKKSYQTAVHYERELYELRNQSGKLLRGLGNWFKGNNQTDARKIEQVRMGLIKFISSLGRLLQPMNGLNTSLQITNIYTFAKHSGPVYSVAFSPNSTLLASGSKDKKIYLWEVASGTVIQHLRGHSDNVNSVTFSPDGSLLASGSDDDTVKLWEVKTGKIIHELQGYLGDVNSVAFSPNGVLLATGADGELFGTRNYNEHRVRVWDVKSGKIIHQLKSLATDSVAFSPDNNVLAADGKLWRVKDGTEIGKFVKHSNGILSLAFSPDGSLLASGGRDCTAKLCEVKSGKIIHQFTGNSVVYSVAFSPDGSLLAIGSVDGSIILGEVRSGKVMHQSIEHSHTTISVTFSPDGSLLASGSVDGTVKLWVLRYRFEDTTKLLM